MDRASAIIVRSARPRADYSATGRSLDCSMKTGQKPSKNSKRYAPEPEARQARFEALRSPFSMVRTPHIIAVVLLLGCAPRESAELRPLDAPSTERSARVSVVPQQAPELAADMELFRPAVTVQIRGVETETGSRGRLGLDRERWQPVQRSQVGQIDAFSGDQRPPGSEKARIAKCAGRLDETLRARVGAILQRRMEANPKDPGTDRFLVLGASASRAQSFLNGFGAKHYTLAPDWEYLRPTIEHFSQRPRPLNSFRRKHATVSGTTAGSFIWSTRFCPDCPQKLEKELRTLRPAFAVVMFGTNNVSWGGPPGYKGLFDRRMAKGHRDDWCRHVPCLPPWKPGPLNYHKSRGEQILGSFIAKGMKNKSKMLHAGMNAVIKRLLEHNIVPLITTVPPMPRKWLDEDTVARLNADLRDIAAKHRVPLIDFWCALSPMTADGQLDFGHPVMTSGKGIGPDRYHPTTDHAFDIADEHLMHGYNARNTLTLLRLHELRELTATIRQARNRDETQAGK
ncbi:MAG: hypothetical protein ACI9OJ_000768 [Myxococcota bacterium]|jgi:hypothetical protein